MPANMFITLTDVEGEVKVKDHDKGVEVLSWSHSFSQSTSPTRVSAGSGTVEYAHHSDFSFTKYSDSSTHSLLKFCWNGKQVKEATFAAYRSDGSEENAAVKYLEIKMEEVIISNVSLGGGAGDISTENVSLNYGKITYNYIPQKKEDGTKEGTKSVSHDLTMNKVS